MKCHLACISYKLKSLLTISMITSQSAKIIINPSFRKFFCSIYPIYCRISNIYLSLYTINPFVTSGGIFVTSGHYRKVRYAYFHASVLVAQMLQNMLERPLRVCATSQKRCACTKKTVQRPPPLYRLYLIGSSIFNNIILSS